MYLTEYGHPLIEVSSFKYLGRVLSDSDNNCMTVALNLRKEWKKWDLLSRVLVWEGADAWALGVFTWRCFRRCYYLYRRCGLFFHALVRFWADFSTR